MQLRKRQIEEERRRQLQDDRLRHERLMADTKNWANTIAVSTKSPKRNQLSSFMRRFDNGLIGRVFGSSSGTTAEKTGGKENP